MISIMGRFSVDCSKKKKHHINHNKDNKARINAIHDPIFENLSIVHTHKVSLGEFEAWGNVCNLKVFH